MLLVVTWAAHTLPCLQHQVTLRVSFRSAHALPALALLGGLAEAAIWGSQRAAAHLAQQELQALALAGALRQDVDVHAAAVDDLAPEPSGSKSGDSAQGHMC